MNLLVRDKESGKTYVIEIGSEGYDMFLAQKTDLGVSTETIDETEEYSEVEMDAVVRKNILEDIRYFADEVGHIPSESEIEAEESMVSIETIKEIFGSYDNALIKAGLKTIKTTREAKKEAIIIQIQNLAKELGHTPDAFEMGSSNNTESVATCRELFGSYEKAVRAAGLEPKELWHDYSKDRKKNSKIV